MELVKKDSATREDLGLLAVMDVLADEEQVTQRELSRRTGLNLKKVNYCLHKLLEKGHVKFQRVVNNPDKRTYLYILTPAGFKAKSHLTYRFLKVTLDFYNQVEVKLKSSLNDMASTGVKKIVLFGASEASKIVLELVVGTGIEVVGVIERDTVIDSFGDLPVLVSADLKEVEWDGILITALEGLEEVEAELCDWGLPEDRIWHLS
jgi:DNA-binding MarR family transcriptional regulator